MEISSLLIGIAVASAIPDRLKSLKGYNQTLLKATLKKRDLAIETATKEFSSSLKSAYDNQKQRLEEASGLLDKRLKRQLTKQARTEYRLERKNAFHRLEEAKNEAWENFRSHKKLCLIRIPKPELFPQS